MLGLENLGNAADLTVTRVPSSRRSGETCRQVGIHERDPSVDLMLGIDPGD